MGVIQKKKSIVGPEHLVILGLSFLVLSTCLHLNSSFFGKIKLSLESISKGMSHF